MEAKFLREAIRLSLDKLDLNEGGPFGAVVVKGDRVVGVGWNRVTSRECPDATAHAEIVAIRDACRTLGTFKLDGCVIYVSCEPCPMCQAAIRWARLDECHFAATREDAAAAGFDDAAIAAELGPEMPRQAPTCDQAIRREALAAFDAWRQKQDRCPY